MSRFASLRWSVPISVLAGVAAITPAVAHDARTGGASMPRVPEVETLRCVDGSAFECGRGERLTVQGEGLLATRSVTFLGGPGRADDRGARPHRREAHRLSVVVPEDAAPGPVRVLARTSSRTQRSEPSRPLELQAGSESVGERPAGDAVFPIQGAHAYGESGSNRFGSGRGHQGQDVFADCGTPLVAAEEGTVERAGFEGAMGNHVVVELAGGASHVYMHLAGPPRVQAGDAVSTGQALGAIGETGRATGCHLHFEIWNAPGWTRGTPVDPLSELRQWDGNN